MTHDILTEAELASLIAGDSAAEPTDASPNTGATSRASVPPLELRRLQRLHESFAGRLADRLSQRTRLVVRITLEELATVTSGEWLRRLTSPTCLGIAEVAEWDLPLICELHTSVFYPILDRLLGGSGEPCDELRRPLTAVELQLAEGLVASFLETWSDVVPWHARLLRMETHPSSIAVIAPEERIIGVSLHVSLPQAHGTIKIAIPAENLRSPTPAAS